MEPAGAGGWSPREQEGGAHGSRLDGVGGLPKVQAHGV